MYCLNCGSSLSENAKFCNACGTPLSEQIQNIKSEKTNSTDDKRKLVGFSPKVNDPAFAKYIKNTNSWSWIFSLILAFAAVIGFYIAGETSSEMNNPESLYIGFGIGGMFVLIALSSIIGRKKSKTWDGAVADKNIQQKRRKRSSGDNDYYWEDYTVFTVFIRATNGKQHTIRVENDDTIYNYYKVGDRVRHHAGLNTYEKYDKSADSIIFCSACATMNDISEELCFRCKCPLLK